MSHGLFYSRGGSVDTNKIKPRLHDINRQKKEKSSRNIYYNVLCLFFHNSSKDAIGIIGSHITL